MRTVMLVALGGAIGACARWIAASALDSAPGEFPWATLLVNVAGCVLVGVAARRLTRTSDAWAFCVSGVIGGLTTFSAFALETRDLLDAQRPGIAALYVGVSLVAGVGAVEIAGGQR